MKKTYYEFLHLLMGHTSMAKAFLYAGDVDGTHEFLSKLYNTLATAAGEKALIEDGKEIKK